MTRGRASFHEAPKNEGVVDHKINRTEKRTQTRRRRDEQQYAASFHVIYLRIQRGHTTHA